MQHKVGDQGLVVPFGYVTVVGHPKAYQQGQFIPPGSVISEAKGDNENDPARSTTKLHELIGIKVSKPVTP